MLIVDTHCDTLYARAVARNGFTGGKEPQVTPQRLREGGVSLQVCALFSGDAGPAGTGDRAPAALAQAQLAAVRQLTDAGIRKVDSPLEAREGEACLMLSIEGGEIVGGSIETLRAYRSGGIRLLALTWNFENDIACPHCVPAVRRRPGLKPAGREIVREMARLGIAADVAHLSEDAFWDLIFRGEAPPMTSHSCCRALHNHTRNLTDDQIRALIDCGGWIGINFFTRFLTCAQTATAETVVDHIAHIAELGGVKHVGFGSDFDGIDSAPLDLQHPGQMPNLLAALRRRGFSQNEIEGIAGRSFVDYFLRMERAAQS